MGSVLSQKNPRRYSYNIAATEVEGTFRVNGSNKRMRELQALFEKPPKVSI
jgi:hypothetical protein